MLQLSIKFPRYGKPARKLASLTLHARAGANCAERKLFCHLQSAIASSLGELNARVTRIAVTELRESTFYAVITLQVNGSEIDVDSRPSDALALAVRTSAPIYVADQVIDDSAIEFGAEDEQQDVVDEFKKFLENVNPDDFAGD